MRRLFDPDDISLTLAANNATRSSTLTNLHSRQSLSKQIVRALIVSVGLGILGLVFVGYNAINIADTAAEATQERLATRSLQTEINQLPEQQQSATIWDEAIRRIGILDQVWIDSNLGAWMQIYFGHNESYILDQANRPIFASIAQENLPPEVYNERDDTISSLVDQLRTLMSEVSKGVDNPYEVLAAISVVAVLRFDTGVSLVSVVPIISDSGTVFQAPGTEYLHVAVRYFDSEFAKQIGYPVELHDVAFEMTPPGDGRGAVPVADPSGEKVAWLVWKPTRPGMGVFKKVFPLLLVSGMAIILLLWWVVHHLKRVSEKLSLSEARLQQAHKLKAVGQLTGGIAHDFNNLLTVIMGTNEVIQDSLGPDHPLREFTDMNAEAASRAAQLTRRLLAFSRKQALQPKLMDANAVISGIRAMLRRTLSADIDIKIVAAMDLWRTEVDIGQFEAALLNLAINSRDAMPEGGILTVETTNVLLDENDVASEPGLAAGEFVLIAVGDTGHGIPKDLLDRVFEPFFTTKTADKGTGLGLSSVYGFVKQSRGHICVRSRPGDGTTVNLYFPRKSGTAWVPQVVQSRSALLTGQETILIVEDDSRILKLLTNQLASLNYKVLAAHSGGTALAILREHPETALLLTDIVLPGGMNGLQIAEAAREIRPDLKVLYTSGYAESELLDRARFDCGTEMLSKPYTQSELSAKIRKALSLKDAA